MSEILRRRDRALFALARHFAVLVAGLLTLMLANVQNSLALGTQTREQCNSCCKKKGYDDYFEKQCTLKCFRNHDHCTAKTSAPAPRPGPARPPSGRPPAPATAFQWPNPLNLTPGREWEAASQILSVNGMRPEHPNHEKALREIEMVLVEFARTNPGGGQLPTARLRAIMRKYKR